MFNNIKTKMKRAFYHPSELADPLTNVEIIGSTSGSFVMTLLFVVTSTFMAYYYTDVVGLSAAVVGTIMLITRIIDAFTDIVMGMIVEKTKSRFGKARPWILLMLVPLFISIVSVFSVPVAWSNEGKIIYVFITYNLMINITFTAIGTAGAIIGPYMTNNEKSREICSVICSIVALIGGMFAVIMTQSITAAKGDTPQAWQNVAIILAIIAFFGQEIQFLFTKERNHKTSAAKKEKRKDLKSILPALLKNKYAVIMFCISFLASIDAAIACVSMYYYKFVFNKPDIIAIIGIVTLPTTLLGIIVTPILANKIRKKTLVIVGTAIKLITFVIIAIFPANIPLYVVLLAIRSLAGGPMMVFSGVFLLNTIEYGEKKTGMRSESMTVTLSSFCGKVGTGIGSALIGWLLAFGGYISNSIHQPDSVRTMIIFISCIIPAMAAIIQIVLISFYDLDHEHRETVKELELKKSA